ncbi:hypothetical protein DUNSADRAFT_8948 [Dunaliella salina]|uniref:Uncharacterized protein n=1 Tax=Dunaliella salina TaxID=3046 RepID=A0ABQ7GIE6_DUNSA|nr:hypothetical protein DUNSADRAFT_8948 [Dunaliella salina]|eukprot:KAF5834393.1 hypothetical protein DUNSADRAFT_8948 [Dunaliella salina]
MLYAAAPNLAGMRTNAVTKMGLGWANLIDVCLSANTSDLSLFCSADPTEEALQIFSDIVVDLGDEGISVVEWTIGGTNAANFAVAFTGDLQQAIELGCEGSGTACPDPVVTINSIWNYGGHLNPKP